MIPVVQSVGKTGAWLVVILSGQIGALELLFEGSGGGVSTGSAIRLYADDPVSRSCNLYASEAAKSMVFRPRLRACGSSRLVVALVVLRPISSLS